MLLSIARYDVLDRYETFVFMKRKWHVCIYIYIYIYILAHESSRLEQTCWEERHFALHYVHVHIRVQYGSWSKDFWNWTSGHGPCVHVGTFTRYLNCFSVSVMFSCFVFGLGGLSGSAWGHLGDQWGSTRALSEHHGQVKRKNENMRCDMVMWFRWDLNLLGFYVSVFQLCWATW